jgi:hypothetical protein
MKYSSLGGNGDGIVIRNWKDTHPRSGNQLGGPDPSDPSLIMSIWADNGPLGLRVILGDKATSVSNPLSYHDYKLEHIDRNYYLYR